MRRAYALALLIFATPAAAGDPDSSPSAAMRTLQVLQEQVAHGNATAQAAQPKLMEHIADGFLAADPAVWKDQRNGRAAILFLLSGGRPATIRTVMNRSTFPTSLDRLIKGSLAYGEGQDDIARALLDPIDPQSLPSSLGSHVALVKGGLFADRDPAKAIALLDMARLLAPGTLIEEAALRREVFLLIDSGDVDKGMLLARQYVRRFRTSAYAANFKQRFAAAAATMASAGDTVRLAKLDSVLNELPSSETRHFYLALARSSILAGKTTAARFAAEKVRSIAGADTAAAAQAALYIAAALVVADDATQGLVALKAVETDRLSPDDQNLKAAALAIGMAIQADSPKEAGTDPGGGAADPTQATLNRARSALAESARLLQQEPK